MILLLRTQLSVSLYDDIDEELRWEGRDLPDPEEMTMGEMPDDETGEAVGDIDDEGISPHCPHKVLSPVGSPQDVNLYHSIVES